MIKKLRYEIFIIGWILLHTWIILSELFARDEVDFYLLELEDWDKMSIIPGVFLLFCEYWVAKRINELCQDIGKQSANGVLVGILSNLTLGIYGYYWLHQQFKRLEEKAGKLHTQSVNTAAKKGFIAWLVSNVIGAIILIYYEDLYYGMFTYELIWEVMNIYHAITIVTSLLIAVYGYCLVNEINRLIDVHNELLVNTKDNSTIPEKEEIFSDNVQLSVLESFTPNPIEPVTVQDDSVKQYFLVCKAGMYKDVSFPLERNTYIMIGRDGQNANIVIDNNTVSRQHCQIRYNIGKQMFEVIDYSSVGTFVNGEKITPKVIFFCPKGSYIQLGTSDNIFELQEERRIS